MTLVRRDRVGVAMNFLLSVQASRGNVVAFADQDDVWLPRKLERSMEVLRQHDAVLVMHGAKTVDEELRPKRSGYRNVRRPRIAERLQGNLWLTVWGNTMLFRRSLLDGCDWAVRPRCQWSEVPCNHDDLVGLLALVRGRTVRLPDQLLLYRQHGRNVGGAPPAPMDKVRRYSRQTAALGHAAELEHRAQVAFEWAEYFTPLVSPDRQRQTGAYFRDAGELARARAERLARAVWRASASIGAAAVRGEYSNRTTAGFGWRALVRDLHSLLYFRAHPS